jgi:hypothetical protein
MYLTYNAPITTDDLYETVFHISCTNANEEHSEDSVVSGIWDGFSGRNVKRKDGTELTYYASYQTDTTTVTGLLSNTDGQCGAWASFFQTALAIHGIQSEYKKFRSNPTFADGFIVKTWSFSGTGDVGSNFPYTNKLHPSLPLVGTTQYNWGTPAEVTYTEGNPGQNNSMPASFFNNHQLIKYGNKYYDPSYGVIYESVQKIDETLGVNENEEVEITPGVTSMLDGRCFLDLDMMTERIEAFKFMKSSTGIDMVCIGCDDHWGYINVFHDDFGKFNVEDTFSGAEINMVRENNSLVREIPQSRFYEILFEVNTVIEEAKKREKKFKERQKYIFANL